jgi:hypothetical protein
MHISTAEEDPNRYGLYVRAMHLVIIMSHYSFFLSILLSLILSTLISRARHGHSPSFLVFTEKIKAHLVELF